MENSDLLVSDGFLDPKLQHWIQESRKRYPEWHRIAGDVNRFSLNVLFSLDARNGVIEELLLASLYLRILHTFQGAILLAERGMLTQGRMLARSMLEAVFPLAAIAKDSGFAKEYANKHKLQQLKFFRKAQQLGSEMVKELEDPETKQLVEELKDEIDNLSIKVLRTEDIAKKAGLHIWYLTAYAVLSGTVHSKAGDLEEYLVLGPNGEIKEFDWGPSSKGLRELLMTVTESMLMAVEHVKSICTINVEVNLEQYRNQLNKLVSKELIAK